MRGVLLSFKRFLLGSLLCTAAYFPAIVNMCNYTTQDMAVVAPSETAEYLSNLIFNDETNQLLSFSGLDIKVNPEFQSFNNEFIAEVESGILATKEKVESNNKKHISDIKIVDISGYPDSRLVSGKIKTNFYADARGSGVPAAVVDSVIKNMSKKINFRRSLKIGDSFNILYSKKNELLYARIKTKRKDVEIYKAQDGKNSVYCFADGEVTKNTIVTQKAEAFGQPLRGRLIISDRFGIRRHPITKVIKHHNGVDLRAAHGQPVYAIYDGVVTRASFYYGYGKCIDLEHPRHYSSRYAHLSSILVRNGQFIKKGQLIGYVGSTGHSTGPHLHLELARYNRVMNPMTVKMMQREEVKSPVIKADAKRLSIFRKVIEK